MLYSKTKIENKPKKYLKVFGRVKEIKATSQKGQKIDDGDYREYHLVVDRYDMQIEIFKIESIYFLIRLKNDLIKIVAQILEELKKYIEKNNIESPSLRSSSHNSGYYSN
ncbi:MAG: hypothetical protein ACTSRK_12835 [Promethearchaeota archaeon]